MKEEIINKKIFGEVFTPFNIIEKMLDELPKNVWLDPNLTWLDPAMGTGNFFVCIYDRLFLSLCKEICDETERRKHILENMLFGVEIQERNFKTACNVFDHKKELNLNFKNYDSLIFDFWGKTFDIVVGNPPYQKEIKNSSNPQASDLYPDFIDISYRLSNRFVLMITPSRWFLKRSLLDFRSKMINDYHIKSINHSDNSKLFKNADIKGGISYFLLDKEYNDFPYLSFLSSKFDLKSNPEILTIRDLNGLKIYEKASKLKSIDYRFCPKSFWGVKTNSKDFLNFEEKNSILCYVSKAKGFKKYILKNRVQNIDKINKWKVILRAADGKGYDSTSYCFIAKPGEICSESYVLFIFDTEIEAINFVKYFNTKIFKYLMSIKKIKQDVTKEVFSIIPDIDFLSDFNLKELYEKLELDCNDISFIENYNCL